MKTAHQLSFPPALPTALNNVDDPRRERDWKRMDEVCALLGQDLIS